MPLGTLFELVVDRVECSQKGFFNQKKKKRLNVVDKQTFDLHMLL